MCKFTVLCVLFCAETCPFLCKTHKSNSKCVFFCENLHFDRIYLITLGFNVISLLDDHYRRIRSRKCVHFCANLADLIDKWRKTSTFHTTTRANYRVYLPTLVKEQAKCDLFFAVSILMALTFKWIDRNPRKNNVS